MPGYAPVNTGLGNLGPGISVGGNIKATGAGSAPGDANPTTNKKLLSAAAPGDSDVLGENEEKPKKLAKIKKFGVSEKTGMAKAAIFGMETALNNALYRQRMADKVSKKPALAHLLTTGQAMPLTGAVGYSKMLPLILSMMVFKYPRTAAVGMAGQQVAKHIYDLTHDKDLYGDIPYAKALKNPKLSQRLLKTPMFSTAAKSVVKEPIWKRILNLG